MYRPWSLTHTTKITLDVYHVLFNPYCNKSLMTNNIISPVPQEEYLTEVFEGCLVVVSHDNFFVNRVAEHLFVFEGDGVVRDFEGRCD